MNISLQCIKTQRPPSPKLAVLFRVKNEIKLLDEMWRGIERQTAYPYTEFVFLDSGSTDGTMEFLSQLPIMLYTIRPEDFQFGSSCNLIASLSIAPNLVFLSGHVLLERNDSLEKVLGLLNANPWASVYMRQIPNRLTGASAYETAFLLKRFPPRPASTVELEIPAGFSNAASGMTRRAWERNPFPEVDASEDYLWAKRHLELGGQVIYLPDVTVMHSHCEAPEAVYRRVRLNMRARNMPGSRIRATYYFLGVLGSMLRHGSSWGDAWRYAKSHAKAYLP